MKWLCVPKIHIRSDQGFSLFRRHLTFVVGVAAAGRLRVLSKASLTIWPSDRYRRARRKPYGMHFPNDYPSRRRAPSAAAGACEGRRRKANDWGYPGGGTFAGGCTSKHSIGFSIAWRPDEMTGPTAILRSNGWQETRGRSYAALHLIEQPIDAV